MSLNLVSSSIKLSQKYLPYTADAMTQGIGTYEQ